MFDAPIRGIRVKRQKYAADMAADFFDELSFLCGVAETMKADAVSDGGGVTPWRLRIPMTPHCKHRLKPHWIALAN